MNCVVVYDEYKGRMRRRIYDTTLDAKDDPFKIYKCYKDRWTIENQGTRYLSQRWSLRDFAGRSLNSIQARILTVLTLYNAVKILEMKYEDKMERLQEKMREKGERSYLSGCALIVYGRDKYYGISSAVEYARLTTKRRNKEFARELEKILAERGQKKKITELIKKLKQE